MTASPQAGMRGVFDQAKGPDLSLQTGFTRLTLAWWPVNLFLDPVLPKSVAW